MLRFDYYSFMKIYGKLITLVLALGSFAAAKAVPVYVGSWEVSNDQAPLYYSDDDPVNGPLAYTAQEAAALLFGGVASDYYISTISANVADINHQGWYDVIGLGGMQFSEDYFNKYLGAYYGPTDGYDDGNLLDNAASAFVQDNLSDGGYVNYAFRIVPDNGATVALLGTGLLALMAIRRRQA